MESCSSLRSEWESICTGEGEFQKYYYQCHVCKFGYLVAEFASFPPLSSARWATAKSSWCLSTTGKISPATSASVWTFLFIPSVLFLNWAPCPHAGTLLRVPSPTWSSGFSRTRWSANVVSALRTEPTRSSSLKSSRASRRYALQNLLMLAQKHVKSFISALICGSWIQIHTCLCLIFNNRWKCKDEKVYTKSQKWHLPWRLLKHFEKCDVMLPYSVLGCADIRMT